MPDYTAEERAYTFECGVTWWMAASPALPPGRSSRLRYSLSQAEAAGPPSAAGSSPRCHAPALVVLLAPHSTWQQFRGRLSRRSSTEEPGHT
jgi:hypothetical protein